MTENWLELYLLAAARDNMCTGIQCTTCGAQDFRLGVLRALATASGEAPASRMNAAIAARVARALAAIDPDHAGTASMLEAAQCLVYDLCSAHGQREVAGLLGQGWAGEVLRGMQAHARSVREAHRARAEYEGPEATVRRREEKRRLAQERHQRRLLLKQEQDRIWRKTNGKCD